MRPLLIKMQGFGPFRDETQVDFTDVDLVGLVGPTGSGKSTILDAITFALFGRIARLDARAVAPVINALSQEARISFQFELDGQVYTAVRVVRRHGDGASTKEARLERAGESLAAKKDDVDEQVEQLLGMNFDRFTKVVFLPQGKFSAFLHDKPADRQRLLRVLLGLGVYEQLGKRAREIRATSAAQLEVLRPKLDQAGVTDEQIQLLAGRVDDLIILRDQLTERLETRSSLVAELAQLRADAHDFAVLALAVDSLHVPAEVIDLGSRLKAAHEDVRSAQANFTAANAAHVQAKSAVAQGPDRPRVERLLGMRSEVTRLAEHISMLAGKVDAAVAANDNALAVAADMAAGLREAQNHTGQAESAQNASIATLAKAVPRSNLERDMAAHEELNQLTTRSEAIQPQIESQIAIAKSTGAALAKAGRELDTAQLHLRATEDARHAQVLINALAVGDRCPVCDQIVVDLPAHEPSDEIDGALSHLDAARQAVEAARNADSDAGRALAVLEAAQAALAAEVGAATESVALLHSTSDLRTMLATVASLESALTEATQAAELARREERRMRESDHAQTAARNVTDTTAILAGARAELAGATSRLNGLKDELEDAPTQSELDNQLALAEQLLANQRSGRENNEAAETVLDQARAELAKVEEQQESLRRLFSSERDRFVGLDPPQPEHTSVLADWQMLVDWAGGLRDPLLREHRDATTAANELTAEVRTADEEIQAVHRGAVDPDGSETPPDTEAVAGILTRLVATAQAELASGQARQAQLAEDRAQVDLLEEREQVHDLLGVQLRSSGFEQWLLDEVIQTLVGQASERLFELSRGQYSIEAHQMVFQVRDHRNGDELRDARTLSGGETFLASLALALALADSIADMGSTDTPPIECLFLDEGFGTLDPETLDVVASAIEELGAAGRLVGVITHIRDLAERMPVRFEVTKLATTSVVEKVFS